MSTTAPEIGDVAACQSGTLGVVKSIRIQGNGRILYEGTTVDGSRPWQSVRPARVDTWEQWKTRHA